MDLLGAVLYGVVLIGAYCIGWRIPTWIDFYRNTKLEKKGGF